jgi:hypothetical protein
MVAALVSLNCLNTAAFKKLLDLADVLRRAKHALADERLGQKAAQYWLHKTIGRDRALEDT